MNLIDKVIWQAKNLAEAWKTRLLQTEPTGCLAHRPKESDFIYHGANIKRSPDHNYFTVANDLWRFDQRPFNICVFASGVMGASFQEGERYSVRFAVQLAKKLGYITGNGVS